MRESAIARYATARHPHTDTCTPTPTNFAGARILKQFSARVVNFLCTCSPGNTTQMEKS